ncbi:MAG: hypothetical protein Q7R41_11210 [Phycisphaerales bacterium]|nr:hypothetical protein [Phycisphaerales bacterium]
MLDGVWFGPKLGSLLSGGDSASNTARPVDIETAGVIRGIIGLFTVLRNDA